MYYDFATKQNNLNIIVREHTDFRHFLHVMQDHFFPNGRYLVQFIETAFQVS